MSNVANRNVGQVCSLADAPDMRLTSPASGEWTLSRVEDLHRMDDGRLVVLNRGSFELLMFGRDGELLRSIGRLGEGPGEFMDPIEIDLARGDSIVVWDWELGRLTLFGPYGSYGRSVMLQPPVINPTGRVGVLGQDGIVIGNQHVPSVGKRLTPHFLQVLRYGWRGMLVDTLVILPYGERGMVNPEESRLMAGPLFGSRGVFATQGDLLYTSDADSPEVRVYRGRQLKSIVRWEPGDLSVRKGDVEAYTAARLAGVGEDMAEILRKSFEAFPANDAFPAVMEIQIDAQGRMWIRTYDRPGSTVTEWLGFEETGAFICSLSVPRHFRLKHFHTAVVVGVHSDELDVESIEVRSFGF